MPRPPDAITRSRAILLKLNDPPVLLRLTEKDLLRGELGPDSSAIAVNSRIERISGDSLYLNNYRLRFRELSSVMLTSRYRYLRSDSVHWQVYFPPDSIYSSVSSYHHYMQWISRQVKADKAARRSAAGFTGMFTFNLTKLANLEIAYSFERRIKGPWSFEIEAGYQFAAGDLMRDDFFNGLYPLYKYNGVNLVLGPKYYLGKIPYLQMMLVYHYLDMNEARSKYGMVDGDYGLQYQYRNDLGGGLRFGLLTRIGRSGVMDAYIGGGIKMSWVNQFLYGYYPYSDSQYPLLWIYPDHSAQNNHVTMLKPVFNAGIRLGVGF